MVHGDWGGLEPEKDGERFFFCIETESVLVLTLVYKVTEYGYT